jgi:hypothetical protein
MSGADDYAALARRLKEAGEGGLARALRKALNDAAAPITREIRDLEHLKAYLPDRYALILAADVKVSTLGAGSVRNPGVRIQASGRDHKRKVGRLDSGVISHPVYPRGDRRKWKWSNDQTGGMRAGFFTDPCEKSAPQVRDQILKAMHETAAKITDG